MLPRNDCWWWGQAIEKMRRTGRGELEIEAFRSCGADPPCEGNHYNWNEDRRQRESALTLSLSIITILGILLITGIYLLGRYV